MQIRSRNHDVYEKAMCNIVGTFATDTRCWNFVSKLFRSRIYAVSARRFVANLPNVVPKLRLAAGPTARMAHRTSRALASVQPLSRSLTQRGSVRAHFWNAFPKVELGSKLQPASTQRLATRRK